MSEAEDRLFDLSEVEVPKKQRRFEALTETGSGFHRGSDGVTITSYGGQVLAAAAYALAEEGQYAPNRLSLCLLHVSAPDLLSIVAAMAATNGTFEKLSLMIRRVVDADAVGGEEYVWRSLAQAVRESTSLKEIDIQVGQEGQKWLWKAVRSQTRLRKVCALLSDDVDGFVGALEAQSKLEKLELRCDQSLELDVGRLASVISGIGCSCVSLHMEGVFLAGTALLEGAGDVLEELHLKATEEVSFVRKLHVFAEALANTRLRRLHLDTGHGVAVHENAVKEVVEAGTQLEELHVKGLATAKVSLAWLEAVEAAPALQVFDVDRMKSVWEESERPEVMERFVEVVQSHGPWELLRVPTSCKQTAEWLSTRDREHVRNVQLVEENGEWYALCAGLVDWEVGGQVEVKEHNLTWEESVMVAEMVRDGRASGYVETFRTKGRTVYNADLDELFVDHRAPFLVLQALREAQGMQLHTLRSNSDGKTMSACFVCEPHDVSVGLFATDELWDEVMAATKKGIPLEEHRRVVMFNNKEELDSALEDVLSNVESLWGLKLVQVDRAEPVTDLPAAVKGIHGLKVLDLQDCLIAFGGKGRDMWRGVTVFACDE